MGEMNRLTRKITFHIWPALVNKELSKRKKEINPLYKNIVIDNSWADLSEQIDTKLWNLLANENTVDKTGNEITDGDKDIEGNYHFREEEQRALNAEPTVMYNVHGPNIDIDEIISVAPGEGQIPVSRSNDPDCEGLALPNLFSTGKFHDNYNRIFYHIFYPSTFIRC